MPISDIPIFSVLRTRMQWHQERQRVLAENVANADTPHFRPKDLAQPTPDTPAAGQAPSVTLVRTNPNHLTASGGTGSGFATDRKGKFEVRPAGNAVSLEEQMLKVAANQMDYQAVTALYGRSLALIKMAIGKA
jgi:flagellar basal-body rod protein FlgB